MKFSEALGKGAVIVLGCVVGLAFLALLIWGLIKLSVVFLISLIVLGIIAILVGLVSFIIWVVGLIKRRRRR